MGTATRNMILFLMVMSFAFFCLPHAKSCGGFSGGGSSYDFMGDLAFNMDMSSFDEFARDNFGNYQTILPAKSLLRENLSNTTSINQTNSSAVILAIDNPVNSTSNSTIVKLGASGMQDKRLSNPFLLF